MYSVSHNAKGNALFIVLIAIALFAALGIAVTKTSSNTPNTDQYESNIQANELLDWANAVKVAVKTMLMVNGSTETSLSFEDPRSGQSGAASAATNTQNPNSRGPVDEVFNINTGGTGGPAVWRDFSPAAPGLYTTFFNGQHIIDGVGTSAADLAYFIPGISQELCVIINRKAGLGTTVATIPADTSLVTAHFKGEYGSETLDNVNGSPFGCVEHDDDPYDYWFYFVILAR